jgi:TIR domain
MIAAGAGQPKLFVSYSSSNRPVVARIKNQLNQLGVVTWFDRDEIVGGEVWSDEIINGLDGCIGLLLFVSPNSAASTWVQKEYATVRGQGKPVVPVLIAKTDAPWFSQISSELHYVDFQDIGDDVKFIRAIYELVKAICERVTYPDCQAIYHKTQEMIGSEQIRAYLDEVEKNRLAAHAGLDEIRKSCGPALHEWTQDTVLSDRLARFAMGEEIPNPQIMLAAAETIGYCGNAQAVIDLTHRAQDSSKTIRALDALKTIWETRSNGIPNAYLGDLKWRVRLFIIWQQLLAPSAWPELIFAVIAACLGIMFTINIEFYDPQDTFPLTRLGNVASNGIAYGLFIGLGVALASFLIPRLRIFRQLRFILAFLAGWTVVTAAFIAFMNLFYRKVPADWSPVVWLSALFIAGYAIGALLKPNRILKTLLRLGLAFAGVFASLAIPCGWSRLPARLLFFTTDCTLRALFVSALIVLISFLPELRRHVAERGQIFGFFFRLRRTQPR